jgi:hypothetical protein
MHSDSGSAKAKGFPAVPVHKTASYRTQYPEIRRNYEKLFYEANFSIAKNPHLVLKIPDLETRPNPDPRSSV